MANSTLVPDYLGYGLLSARPSAPPISNTCLGIYAAYDVPKVSWYDWNTSAWVDFGSGGGGGSLEVTDGITTVMNVTEIDFTSGATVTNGGTGLAQIAISGGGNVCIDPYGPPTASSFTAFSGDATTPTLSNVSNLGMVFDSGATVNSFILRGATIATPGTDYTLIFRWRLNMQPEANYRSAGIGVSDGTKYIFLRFAAQASNPMILYLEQWASSSSRSADITIISDIYQWWEYLRIKNNGSVRTYSVSTDGTNWTQLYSEAAGTFLTETELAILCTPDNNNDGGTDHIYITVPYWHATSP